MAPWGSYAFWLGVCSSVETVSSLDLPQELELLLGAGSEVCTATSMVHGAGSAGSSPALRAKPCSLAHSRAPFSSPLPSPLCFPAIKIWKALRGGQPLCSSERCASHTLTISACRQAPRVLPTDLEDLLARCLPNKLHLSDAGALAGATLGRVLVPVCVCVCVCVCGPELQ